VQACSGDDENRCLVEIDPRSVGNEPVGVVLGGPRMKLLAGRSGRAW
jgi:hypothetical protein